MPATYINHYAANGGVVVPQFGGAFSLYKESHFTLYLVPRMPLQLNPLLEALIRFLHLPSSWVEKESFEAHHQAHSFACKGQIKRSGSKLAL